MAIGTAAAIAIAASAASSAYAAHKQSQAAGNAEDLQKQLMARQSSLSQMLQNFGNNQVSAAEPAMSAAMRYYMGLATGNRGQINSLLAPQRAQMADTFRGAMSTVSNKLAPGPQREAAYADLAKQQAGMQGLMPMQARQQAMGSLADLGTNSMSRALQAYGGAASALSGAGQAGLNAFSIGQMGNQGWQQFGQQMGNIFIPYLLGKYGKGNVQNMSMQDYYRNFPSSMTQ